MKPSMGQAPSKGAGREKDEKAPACGYFASVRALPGYRLEVVMQTGAVIRFDFSSRMDTPPFSRLHGEEAFAGVTTDGMHLAFLKAEGAPVLISAREFMDLVLLGGEKVPYIDPERP